MASATGSARKVAVLGEMLELGDQSLELHRQCGAAAAAAGIDLLIAVGGPPSAELVRGSRRGRHVRTQRVRTSPTSAEAATLALGRVRPGDLVLVKGSRGIATDVVVERLKEEFA